MKKLGLTRQSDNPTDDLFKVFLSDPIRVTIDPGEKEDTTVEQERILSGDYMKAHLSADFIIAASQQNYINVNQANEIGDVC